VHAPKPLELKQRLAGVAIHGNLYLHKKILKNTALLGFGLNKDTWNFLLPQ